MALLCWCKNCVRAKEREYRAKQRLRAPHIVLARGSRNRRSIRAEVLAAYGGACSCCGEREQNFLGVDHVNNDGSAHRKLIGGGGAKVYWWAKKNGYPPTLQLLCYNCNLAKGFYGICPHKVAEYEVPYAVRMEA